jgi:predicted TIM-barrel enzyme
VVVSGSGTGRPTDDDTLAAVRETLADVAPAKPLLVGSGVTAESVGATLSGADGAIVGSALKEGGETTNPVDVDRVRERVANVPD